MRELRPLPVKKIYNSEFNILDDITLKKGSIAQTDFTNSVISEMVEGEARIDTVNNRKVTKIDGKIYKEVVNVNNEVEFQEII